MVWCGVALLPYKFIRHILSWERVFEANKVGIFPEAINCDEHRIYLMGFMETLHKIYENAI